MAIPDLQDSLTWPIAVVIRWEPERPVIAVVQVPPITTA